MGLRRPASRSALADHVPLELGPNQRSGKTRRPRRWRNSRPTRYIQSAQASTNNDGATLGSSAGVTPVKFQGRQVFATDLAYRRGLHVIAYRAMLDVPSALVRFLAVLLAAERRAVGTRTGTRALTCF
jgi:hypothetical protein